MSNKGPIKNSESNLADGVPEMKYPSMWDSKNVPTEKTKLRKEKVVHRDSKTGHVYGSRVVYQHTTESLVKELLNLHLNEADATSPIEVEPKMELPASVASAIKTNIRKGAKDVEQKWESAIELTNKAYEVANVPLPTPSDEVQWKTYEQLLQYAVRQLALTRGNVGEWRMTDYFKG